MLRIIKTSADGPLLRKFRLKCLLCGNEGWIKTSRTGKEVEQMERCPFCQVNYRKEFRLADTVWVRWDWPKPGIVEAKVIKVDVDTLTLSLVGVKSPPPDGVRSWPPVIVFAKELVGWTPDEVYKREMKKVDDDTMLDSVQPVVQEKKLTIDDIEAAWTELGRLNKESTAVEKEDKKQDDKPFGEYKRKLRI